MYAASIFVLGILPTLILFIAAQYEAKGVGPGPLKVMAWTWLLGYTLKSLYLGFAVMYDLPFRPAWVAFYIIDLGQIAITLGVVSAIAGYFFASSYAPRSNSFFPPTAPKIDWRYSYWGFFGLSLGLLAIYFQQMGFVEQVRSLRFVATKFFIDEEGERNALGFLSIGGDWLVVFFVYWLAMSRKLSLANVYTGAILFVSLTGFLSSRRNVILSIIIVTVIVVSVRTVKKLSAEQKVIRLAGILGAVMVALLLLSFSSQIRDGNSAGRGIQDLNLTEAVGTSATHAFEGAYFIDPAKPAGIIDMLDTEDELFWGGSYTSFLIAPIPRLIWSDKPVIRLGPFVAQDLFTYGGKAGMPPGGIGEAYLNFGWPGIPISMAIFGVFLAIIRNRQNASVDQRYAIARYSLLCMAAIYFVTVEFTAAIVVFLKYIPAVFIVERYWSWMAEQQGRLERKRIARAEHGRRATVRVPVAARGRT